MSKPLPIFSQMPWHIKQKIVDSVDPFSRCALRKCSRDFRNIVDNAAFDYFQVLLGIKDGTIEVLILANERSKTPILRIGYHSHREGCVVTIGDCEKAIKGKNPFGKAVGDLIRVISNPKFTVCSLLFTTVHDVFGKRTERAKRDEEALVSVLLPAVANLEHRLNVKYLSIGYSLSLDQLLRFLSAVRPGTNLSIRLREDVLHLDRLTDSEHWKQCKSMDLYAGGHLPIEKMTHMLRIGVQRAKLSLRDVKMLVKMALHHGEDFQCIRITIIDYYDSVAVHEYLSGISCRGPSREDYSIAMEGSEKHLAVFMGCSLLMLMERNEEDEEEIDDGEEEEMDERWN